MSVPPILLNHDAVVRELEKVTCFISVTHSKLCISAWT